MVQTRLLVLCTIGLISRTAAAQEMDVRDFVREAFFHGVPYEQASQYDSSVVPTLLEMLADSGEELYWTNIVGVLGIIGDERAVAPLIAFAEEDVEGTVSHAHYAATSSVPLALGYLINKSGNQEALNYLTESLNPNVWNTRGLTWTSPYHATSDERNVQLTTTAIMGLGLSGHPDAGEALRSLQRPDSTLAVLQAQVGGVLSDALSAHEMIAELGLVEYHRRRQNPENH